jgi:hypothetical protein
MTRDDLGTGRYLRGMYGVLFLASMFVACRHNASDRQHVTASDKSASSTSNGKAHESGVDLKMRKFARGEFDMLAGSEALAEPLSGWIMTTESGEQFSRSFLQRQAKSVIAFGPGAYGDLMKWVEHDQMEIRYIAVFSLEQTSGKRFGFPHFASLEEVQLAGWKDKLANTLLSDCCQHEEKSKGSSDEKADRSSL